VISEKTGVSLGFVVVVVGSVMASLATGSWWLAQRFDAIDASIKEGHSIMRQIQRESVRLNDFEKWNFNLQNANHGINVPKFETGGGVAPVDVPHGQ
jgi:hypothetical protein